MSETMSETMKQAGTMIQSGLNQSICVQVNETNKLELALK